MKIGIFDSGLGGLIILKAIQRALPEYDYVYLGDTENLPYGTKTQAQIYKLTQKGVEFLFKQDCALVLVMCNTASSKALRKLQREWLPKNYPNRRILGPIIPTVEYCRQANRVGVLATPSTVDSKVYLKEFKKVNPGISVVQVALPQVVIDLEKGDFKKAEERVKKVLNKLEEKKVDTLILSGCTHFVLLKNFAREHFGKKFVIISQDEIIPKSLKIYLARHPEIFHNLSREGSIDLMLTKMKRLYIKLVDEWFKPKTRIREVFY